MTLAEDPLGDPTLSWLLCNPVFSDAEWWFFAVDRRVVACLLKPMWKPVESPEWMYDAKLWSGCIITNSIQLERHIGEGEGATRLGRILLCTPPALLGLQCKHTVPSQC